MLKLKSCGVMLFRSDGKEFLILHHPDRCDLPKGHIKEGETDIECVFRELQEETGFTAQDVVLDPHFRYESTYYPRYNRFGDKKVEKTIVIYLGWLITEHEIKLGEHVGFEWMQWAPPHHFQEKTIYEVLKKLENSQAHFAKPTAKPNNKESGH